MYDVDEWIEKAEDQYSRGRYSEALISSEQALRIDNSEVNAWWFMALSYQELGNLDDAFDAVETVTTLAPNFANGWARYGAILENLYDETENRYTNHISACDAYEKAIDIDNNHYSALSALARIYEEKDSQDPDDIEREIYVLTRIDAQEYGLKPHQLYRLGLHHFNNKNFFESIKYWERSLELEKSCKTLLHLGLAYSHPEVSQDADAIDVWRLAKKQSPEYFHVLIQIRTLLPKILRYSGKQRFKTILKQDQWYTYYINPFELINYSGSSEISMEIDTKEIKKQRRLLMQEIELEDGIIPWVRGLKIDRSRAIKICDDLANEKLVNYHLHVFNNKPLAGFLSRGEHKHFEVNEHWSPLETIEYLEDHKNGFRDWLTPFFKKQFENVLLKAISDSNPGLIKILMDGRRWASEPNSEELFKKAQAKIEEKIRSFAEKDTSKTIKPVPHDIRLLLQKTSIPAILNVLPIFFWKQQDHAISILRSIALNCFNEHGDAELAQKILNFTHDFNFKSKKHNTQIKRDLEILEDIINEGRKHEASLTINGKKGGITRDRVYFGNQQFPTSHISSVRWGLIIGGTRARQINNYFFNFKSDTSDSIQFKWSTVYSHENDKINDSLINATLHYLIPSILQKQLDKLDRGQNLYIGDCKISKAGVYFESTEWMFFSRTHFIPWAQVSFDIANGEIVVIDRNTPKKKINLSLRNTDNAITLQLLQEELK